MTMILLMCPHCGGRLQIDPTLRLQSMLTCPYCSRKSLMQKKDGQIVLRGIITAHAPNETLREGFSETAEPTVDRVVDPVQHAEAEPAPESVSGPEPEPENVSEPESDSLAVPEPEPKPDEPDQTDEPVVEPKPALEPVAEPKAVPEADQATEQDADMDRSPEPEQAEPEQMVEEKPVLIKQPVDADLPDDRQERLVQLATRAAQENHIMVFNSYARQAIDCDPTDPRMYALRSNLIERAHGFARATFLSPVWMSYTPRHKAFVLAQHFSSFNAAVLYSEEQHKTTLAEDTGRLIAWQIRESLIENARLRLGKQPFNGKFHRQDLGTVPRVIDALRNINETVVPQVADQLLLSIRNELDKLDPKLYYKMLRIGL